VILDEDANNVIPFPTDPAERLRRAAQRRVQPPPVPSPDPVLALAEEVFSVSPQLRAWAKLMSAAPDRRVLAAHGLDLTPTFRAPEK
jgi:hypothetical protein